MDKTRMKNSVQLIFVTNIKLNQNDSLYSETNTLALHWSPGMPNVSIYYLNHFNHSWGPLAVGWLEASD